MWARLDTWQVSSGDVTELVVGDTLPHVGLRLSALWMREAQAPIGVVAPLSENLDRTGYEVTGVVEWSRPPSTVLLRAGDLELLAEPDAVREVPGPHYALEKYSPDFHIARRGVCATAAGRLELVAEYEWESFDYPDLRRDWVVVGIELQELELVRGGDDGGLLIGARVLRRRPLAQLDRRLDEPAVEFVLDLVAAS